MFTSTQKKGWKEHQILAGAALERCDHGEQEAGVEFPLIPILPKWWNRLSNKHVLGAGRVCSAWDEFTRTEEQQRRR